MFIFKSVRRWQRFYDRAERQAVREAFSDNEMEHLSTITER